MRLGRRAFVERGVLVLRIRVRVRVRVRVRGRAVTRPVARAATLVATGGRRSCFLHFRSASSLQLLVSPFYFLFFIFFFSFSTNLAGNNGGKVVGLDLVGNGPVVGPWTLGSALPFGLGLNDKFREIF